MYHVLCACLTGYKSSKQPELKLDGFAFNPCNLYRTGVPALTMYNPHNPWPKTDIRTFPTWRGPRAYYGFYHEELDVHHNGGYRYPRDPRVLVNDEDIMKYEYMRNMPHCYQKLPVEFPVLMWLVHARLCLCVAAFLTVLAEVLAMCFLFVSVNLLIVFNCLQRLPVL